LNQIELWFAKIERDVIAQGVFASVKDLARKLMRHIHLYNKTPKPVKWMYRNVLTREELGRIGTVLDQEEDATAVAAFKLCLFTGARPGEVISARWVDLSPAKSRVRYLVRMRSAYRLS
jgi:integrase